VNTPSLVTAKYIFTSRALQMRCSRLPAQQLTNGPQWIVSHDTFLRVMFWYERIGRTHKDRNRDAGSTNDQEKAEGKEGTSKPERNLVQLAQSSSQFAGQNQTTGDMCS
jgi:hypothetical protein